MRVLIYTDPHFCEKSSIVTKLGDKYSVRLENLIKSINWAEDLALKKGCKYVICAGDFFDKPNLTQQEITAVNEIIFAPFCKHYFLVGNHESEENDLHYNSTEILQQDKLSNRIIAEPTLLEEPGFELAFLPYITEARRRPVDEYFPKAKAKRLLISHNDLFGVQMGPAVSAVGFKPADLESICDTCVNGHLHNGVKITDKVINLGNLTGKDFGEDAFRYKHCAMVFETDTWTYELIENPYAFNFYKLDVKAVGDIKKLAALKDNAVASIQCKSDLVKALRDALERTENVVESRVVVTHEPSDAASDGDIADLTVDQYAKFAECCHEKLENTRILDEELAEVLK